METDTQDLLLYGNSRKKIKEELLKWIHQGNALINRK